VVKTNGTGQRVAEAHDASPSQAPILCITYINCGAVGQPCDDGFACTSNEVWDDNCHCVDLSDSDQDGVCDADDVCPNVDDNLIGTSCDDGDPCTQLDQWTSNCDCEGVLLPDADNDGVCDAEDVCPDFNDDIDLDNDGIAYCLDTCVDVDEDGICDDADNNVTVSKLKLKFSHERGYYNGAFNLTLVCNDPNATIRYTTNYAEPSSSSGSVYNSPISINSSTIIRAIAYTGSATVHETHSYLFISDIINDPSMSGHIVNNATWGPQLENSLRDLPVVSMSSSNSVNGNSDVATSFEYFDQNGELSIQENCGVKLYGNASIGQDKKSHRFYFRESYGAKSIEGEFFKGFEHGLEPVTQFDQLELRTIAHDGFSASIRGTWTYIGPQFMENTMLEMGNVHSHGRYVHFFINGQYEGQYQLRERMNDDFMQEYLGGEKEDYEAIDGAGSGNLAGNWTPGTAFNGSGNEWNSLVANSNNYSVWKNMVNEKSYFNHMFTWMWGNHENEMKAVGNTSAPTQFIFRINDGDGAFTIYDGHLGEVIDRTDPNATGPHNAAGHDDMFKNLYNEGDPNFFLAFADEVHCACFDGGSFTPNVLEDRMDELVAEMELSIIAESARWGDSVDNENPNKWMTQVNQARLNMLPSRTAIVINQLKNSGLYPSLDAVEYSSAEGVLQGGTPLMLSNPNSNGSIYYTTDGSDPRNSNGLISNSATLYSSSLNLGSGTYQIKARVKNGSTWSAMCPKVYYVDQDYSNLVINEIHYNPNDSIYFNSATNSMDTVSGRNFEFVELKNTGANAIDIYGTQFTKGINIKIDESLVIPAGGFAVFAEDEYWFEQKYGFPPDGRYTGKLSNSGEKINFKTHNGYFIDTLRYGAGGLWTNVPDLGQFSLALIDAEAENSDYNNWFFQSTYTTPKAENVFEPTGPDQLVINEIHYNPLSGQDDEFIEIVNVSDQAYTLQGVAFTDGIDYTFNLPITLAPASDYPNNYLVLAKDFASFQSAHGFPPFDVYSGSLNNAGEMLLLQAADGSILDRVAYADVAPWDAVPDFGQHSLALLDLDENNLFPQAWSHNPDYPTTPGAVNFPRCPQDFTGDGAINVSDFLELNTHFGLTCNGCPYDLTGDGIVDVSDFLEFNSAFGLSCPTQ
jgi:hypothetical protein